MVFDGSDVGVGGEDVTGFLLLNDGSILMSFGGDFKLSGVGTVRRSDIVQFSPTSLGTNTVGIFSMFFDGSDVGLSGSSEKIDALGVAPDGRLVLSTNGSFSVNGASGRDEDLMVFNASSLGTNTSGSFDLYFDGSDVEIKSEDLESVWIDPINNEIYMAVGDPFSVTGASGDNSDIFACLPGSLGENTTCTYSLFWDGSLHGFGGEEIDGINLGSDAYVYVPGAGPTPTPPPPTATFTPLPPTITPPPPTATFTPLPPTITPPPPSATFTPLPPTPTPTAIPGIGVVYISSSSNGTAGSVSFSDEDILAYDTGSGTWSMVFDGSDVGVGGEDVNGFLFMNDGSILMTFKDAFSLSGIGTVGNSDILQFFPTSLGPNTVGTFSLYFDGSDVGLSGNNERIDALGVAPDGRLVLSTNGSFSVNGASGKDEDLIVFNDTSFGSSTSGSFELYFDGSDVGIASEDLGSVWIDPANNAIYLVVGGPFSVPSASGDKSDIFVCLPGSLGANTSCTYSLFWDGSLHGFGGEEIDGISIVP